MKTIIQSDPPIKKEFIRIQAPCECGCDFRQIKDHVGYITFCDGNQFSGLFFENKKEIKEMIKQLEEMMKWQK